MKARTLEEFAEELRRTGDFYETEFGDEILTLLDLEEEVAEPYSELCGDLDHYAPEGLSGKPEKQLEWFGDRTRLLDEIEEALKEAGREGDSDDAIKELLETIKRAEEILEEHGWPGSDFLDALEKLAEATPTPMEYDL